MVCLLYTHLSFFILRSDDAAGNTKILQHVQKYITMRSALVQSKQNVSSVDANATSLTAYTNPNESVTFPRQPTANVGLQLNGSSSRMPSSRASYESPKDPSFTAYSPPLETSRGVISELARTSEDVMRAANEKLNVARHACDLVCYSAYSTSSRSH